LSAQTIDKIIAVVNDEVIAQSDLDRVLATIEAEYRSLYTDLQELNRKLEQVKENIINQMVEEKLILSEARKFAFKVEKENLEARIEQIREKFPSEKEFELFLEAEELTLKDLRDRFHDQEVMKKAVDYFVRSRIKVDPIEIRLFFKSEKAGLIQPEKAFVRSILIRVDDSCDQYEALRTSRTILERLRKGDDFEDLAKAYSQGVSASDGGSLGYIEKGQLIKEIDEAVFSLDPGGFTDVIKTPQGYRIFKVEERMPSSPLTFARAQELIRDRLYKKKFSELFNKWLEELKQNAYISIKENSTQVESRE